MAKTAPKSIQNTLRNDLGHDLVVANNESSKKEPKSTVVMCHFFLTTLPE